MSKQQFSLRWNNYLRHVTNAFDALRCQEDLVDVTLCCEGKKLRAHKMILSACSIYFKDIFKENPCQHPVIIFRNVRYEDLWAIINFMYHGEVNIAQDQLASFLTTAELLEVQGLTDGTDDKNDESNNELEIIRDQEVSSENYLSDPIFQSKKRKLSLKKNSGKGINNFDERSEVDMTNTDVNNFKLEAVEHSEETSIQLIDCNIPGTSVVAFPNEIQICDTEFQETNLLNELKSPNENHSTDNTPEVAADTSLRDTTQDDGDLVKFRCHVCWKGFKHPTSLTLHKDSHTGKTQCPVCRRSFSRSYDMRSHLMKIHQDQSTTDLRTKIAKPSIGNDA